MISTKKMHKILLANKEVIIKKKEQGISVAEIVQEYNVHKNTIYDLLRECGIKLDYNRNMNIAEHREEIIRKYHQGVPVKEIAEDENFSMFTIYKYLVKWKVREKKKNIVTFRCVERRESISVVPFKERMSPELLNRMKENTRINRIFAKYYDLGDTIEEEKQVHMSLYKEQSKK
jgi:transposase